MGSRFGPNSLKSSCNQMVGFLCDFGFKGQDQNDFFFFLKLKISETADPIGHSYFVDIFYPFLICYAF